MSLEDSFKNYTATNTPEFSLFGLKTYARLVSVYDGDTMTCILPLFDHHYYKFPIRLAGIDSCEIKSKCEKNKQLAIKARDRVIELATGFVGCGGTRKEIDSFLEKNVYLVHLDCLELDKYGRVLAHVRKSPQDPLTFSEILVNESLAYLYRGDTKLTEDEQLEKLSPNTLF